MPALRLSRLLLIVVLASVGVAAIPAVATASMEVSVSGTGDFATVVAVPAVAFDTTAQDVAVSADADTVTVTQRAPDETLIARPPCQSVTATEVSCPRGTGTDARVVGGAGDDVLDASAAPFRVDLDGGEGDDRLTGGEGGDSLTGGAGDDVLDGGPGDDFLDAADDAPDTALTCGDGADRLDDDLADPVSDCEVVAPEWDVEPALSPAPYEVGRAVTARSNVVAQGPTSITIDWLSCTPESCGYVTDQDPDPFSYLIPRSDVGHTIFAIVRATNAAGSIEAQTAATSVIPAAPVPGPLVRPHPPRSPLLPPRTLPRPTVPTMTHAQRRAERSRMLAFVLAPVVADLARRDLARLAAGVRQQMDVAVPDSQITLRCYVSASTARRYGVRVSRRSSRLLVAEGRGQSPPLGRAEVTVRPTRRGRTVLRRARTLRLRVTARAGDARASATVTLRRRRTA